ncbi:MAG: ATP-binding cassette domain-containing protein, partial [Bacteroidota bacterium]
MSEPILMALVQLFAIVAASLKKQVSANTRTILESYLRQHLNSQELEEYLKLFDELLFFHQPDDETAEGGGIDVTDKIRAICRKIQNHLTSKDRLIVFIKFLEFLDELGREKEEKPVVEGQLAEKYILVFKEVFGQPDQEYRNARAFIFDPFGSDMQPQHLLVVDSLPDQTGMHNKHITRDRLDGKMIFLYIPSVRTMICRYLGNDELNLNGHNVPAYRSFVFNNGAILKNLKIAPLYYADVAAQFLHSKEKIKIDFTTKEIEFRFKNSSNGIHPFSLTAESGELIGVMGGSGVGKSTLLNLLNGSLKPHQGRILINGYDLEKDKEKLQGIIGFVPQDDL